MGDVWSDAGLADVFLYMLQSHSLNIPDSWHDTMMDFKSQLRAVTRGIIMCRFQYRFVLSRGGEVHLSL